MELRAEVPLPGIVGVTLLDTGDGCLRPCQPRRLRWSHASIPLLDGMVWDLWKLYNDGPFGGAKYDDGKLVAVVDTSDGGRTWMVTLAENALGDDYVGRGVCGQTLDLVKDLVRAWARSLVGVDCPDDGAPWTAVDTLKERLECAR